MRDIRADLRERLAAMTRQRVELDTRERCLRVLLRDEEVFSSPSTPAGSLAGFERSYGWTSAA
jgi:hypothetical protein